MAKQRYHYFSRNGQRYVYDRSSQVYYNQDTGQVMDPVTRKWVDDPSRQEPKKPPGAFEQLGYLAAVPAAGYVGKEAAEWAGPALASGAKDVGAMFGLGGGGAPAAASAPTASAAAPAGYEAVGTALDGGTMLAPATEAGGGMFSLGGVGSAGNVLLPAAGAYGAYDLLTNDYGQGRGALQGAASGAAMGSYFGIPGAAIGGIVGGLAGFADSKFGSNKGPEQLARDDVRKGLQGSGFLDQGFQITLADGSKFDAGKDGGAMLQNAGQNIDGGSERHYYDVDFSDPRSAEMVRLLDPVATQFTGGDSKLKSDFTGYLVNAALSSGDPIANLKKIYADFGLDPATVPAALTTPQAAPQQTLQQQLPPGNPGGFASLATQRVPLQVQNGNRTWV